MILGNGTNFQYHEYEIQGFRESWHHGIFLGLNHKAMILVPSVAIIVLRVVHGARERTNFGVQDEGKLKLRLVGQGQVHWTDMTTKQVDLPNSIGSRHHIRHEIKMTAQIVHIKWKNYQKTGKYQIFNKIQ